KTKRQLEGILKTTRNPEQRSRVGKDLFKIQKRLEELCPDGPPVDLDDIDTRNGGQANQAYQVINQFPVTPASALCDDDEINFMATMLAVLEREFLPIMSDSQIKMDYSTTSERDSFYS